RNRPRHEDRLSHRAAAVVKTGIGHIHAGKLANKRLVLEEDLQTTLAGLGLIRGVGGIVFATPGDGVHHGRNEMIVAAAAEETDRLFRYTVPAGELLHMLR